MSLCLCQSICLCLFLSLSLSLSHTHTHTHTHTQAYPPFFSSGKDWAPGAGITYLSNFPLSPKDPTVLSFTGLQAAPSLPWRSPGWPQTSATLTRTRMCRWAAGAAPSGTASRWLGSGPCGALPAYKGRGQDAVRRRRGHVSKAPS